MFYEATSIAMACEGEAVKMAASSNRVWRPVIFWVAIICVVCFIPVIGAYFFLTSFTPRPSPFGNEPSLLFDINASDYGEGMQVISLSDQDGRRMLRDSRSSVIYVGLSDGASSVIVALDAGTAQVRWKAELSGSQPYCMSYEWGIRCVAGGELVDVAEREGTVTELATLPSDSYRIRKGGNDKSGDDHVVYLLPVDGRPQDYQVVPLRGEDHAVILPWSPPPTPCAEASVTSFEAADTKASSKGEGVVAAVVIDGWMVLTRVDTGEIIDQRFGELYRDVNSVLVAGNEACGAAWGQVDVSYVHYGNVPVLSVVPLPEEEVPTPPPADKVRPASKKGDAGGQLYDGLSSRKYVDAEGRFGELFNGEISEYDFVDLRGSGLDNAFADGIEMAEGAVRGTTGGGLSEQGREYLVLASGGHMISVRSGAAGSGRNKIMWKADIGDSEWELKDDDSVVMTRDSRGRVTAKSIDEGKDLWSLDIPEEMRWESGVEGTYELVEGTAGTRNRGISLVFSSDSRVLIYG